MRLKLCCEIDLYPDIFEFRGVDRKTYGAIFLRRLQSEKALIFHPWCVSCDSHKAQAQAKKKGGNDNENRKNHSETEGRGSGLPYGKR